MDLFELNNNRAFPSAHALLIDPFKTIWERDSDHNKANAIRLFSLVELVCSPKRSNPFGGVSEDKRMAKVKKEVYGDENYRTTDWMILAIGKYRELLLIDSPSYDLYDAAINGKEKLVNFLREFDLNEKTNAGGLILKPKDITSALTDINRVAKELEEGRTKVNSELIEAAKTRGQREIGDYER